MGPAAFFYICTILSVLFILQLAMFKRRVYCGSLDDNFHAELSKLKAHNASAPTLPPPMYPPKNCPVTGENVNYGEVTERGSTEYILNLMTQFVMFVMIMFARVVMPRDSMTRDQLATLLLNYIGNAAYIIELFESLGLKKTSTSKDITFLTVGLYAVASFQFCLFTVNYNNKDIEQAEEAKATDDELPSI